MFGCQNKNKCSTQKGVTINKKKIIYVYFAVIHLNLSTNYSKKKTASN